MGIRLLLVQSFSHQIFYIMRVVSLTFNRINYFQNGYCSSSKNLSVKSKLKIKLDEFLI